LCSFSSSFYGLWIHSDFSSSSIHFSPSLSYTSYQLEDEIENLISVVTKKKNSEEEEEEDYQQNHLGFYFHNGFVRQF